LNLFDLIDPPALGGNEAWRPSEPPSLAGIDVVDFDTETTGLRWWETDRPIGLSVYAPGLGGHYLPFGHRSTTGNLSEEAVKRWARRELRGKRLRGSNIRFDVHHMREWSVDLEAQGCTVTDVQHYAALLDDHRQRFSQEELLKDFLPDSAERKVTSVGGQAIDGTRMATYHPSVVAVRAIADVRQTALLAAKMMPLLEAQDLRRVLDLEERMIFVVCEMEKNGAIIDEERLNRWVTASEEMYQRLYMDLWKSTGLHIDPTKDADLQRVFEKFDLPLAHTASGRVSFHDNVLKLHDHIPDIHRIRLARKTRSVASKFLNKYQKARDSRGILRYALHQLRANKDEWSEGEAGTVSGRFSSAAIDVDVGCNIQQVIRPGKQREAFGYHEDDDSHDDDIFVIRALHVPASGLFLKSDAMQIEYRLFANYSKSRRLIKAYTDTPTLSFHKMIWRMLQEFKPEMTYKATKDLNFANIYGAGLTKTALMMGYITEEDARQLYNKKAGRNEDPRLAEAKEIKEIYNREIPEAAELLRMCQNKAESIGWVKTLLGRRARFHNGNRAHKALNAVIQGSAADIMKQKLIELHEARMETGLLLRWTVHDEVDGDIPDLEASYKVNALLNRQSFAVLPIPILWEVGTGPNWVQITDQEPMYQRAA